MNDLYKRQIDYLRISVTDLCNLRCIYCMPAEGVPKMHHADLLSFEEIVRLVNVFARIGVKKIRLTGGEPLVRKGIEELVAMLRAVEGIEEITLTTNGQLLEEKAPLLKHKGLGRVNVSLDTLDPEKYKKITRVGELFPVLKGIEAAREAGLFPVKINTVVMKGVNDDEVYDFAEMAIEQGLSWRFIEFMPLGGVGEEQKNYYMSNDILIERLKKNYEMVPYTHKTLISEDYMIPGTKAVLGFISPLSHKFCSRCNRVRMTADGRLLPCLLSSLEYPLRDMVRGGASDEEIRIKIEEAIKNKPKEHMFQGFKPMHTIGG
ncbi:MAG TPA: GTP 3',8-cyclase MoaA [Candidatus Mcinerneyibacteriales bacterium]|nr:GTP 3',8-cyclase MoaA [Candidatus Mcinerneyibacteriales bacterium]